jgi:hypothetical protein
VLLKNYQGRDFSYANAMVKIESVERLAASG